MNTISCMVYNNRLWGVRLQSNGGFAMEEKLYKTLNSTGKLSIIFGILTIVLMIGVGVVSIINGARLLAKKSDVLF